MKEILIELIFEYGLETVLIALFINLLTAIIKTPIKSFAKKLNDSSKITRYIVFIPILIGLIVCYFYKKYITKNFEFNNEFFTLWLTSSSLSLTFYAIFEKIFPSTNKILQDDDLVLVKDSLTNLENILKEILPLDKETNQQNKLILRGKKHEEVASKEE